MNPPESTPPEIYDYAMKTVKEEISGLRKGIEGIYKRLDGLYEIVHKHEDLLWGDSDEPEEYRRPGVVETVRSLKDLADKALVVLRVSRWVFAFIGSSILLLFLQNLLQAIVTVTQGQ